MIYGERGTGCSSLRNGWTRLSRRIGGRLASTTLRLRTAGSIRDLRRAMIPTDLRLLRGIQTLAANLEGTLESAADAEQARTIGLIVEEMIWRQDRPRLADTYAAGFQLLRDGTNLLGNDKVEVSMPAAATVPTDLHADLAQAMLHDLTIRVSRLTAALCGRQETQILAWIEAALDWEIGLWRPATAAATLERGAFDTSPDTIERYLALRLPDAPPRLVAVRQIPGGFSKITTMVSIRHPDGLEEDVVLRAQKPIAPFFMDGADLANEFPVIKFAHRAGLPVAKPLWLELDGSHLGLPFLATSRLPGGNHGDFLGSKGALPKALVKKLVETMALVHAVPIDAADPMLHESHLGKWAQYRSITETTRAYVTYWRGMAERGGCNSSPALAYGFDWLLRNVPECDDPPVLIHGDFGLHNVMIDDGEVSGILDWEACYIGDPADEFFSFARAVSASADEHEIMAWYEAAGGRAPSPYRLAYYAILAALKGPLTGIAALNLVAQHPRLELKPLEVAYRFVRPPLEQIGKLIRVAAEIGAREREMS